MRRGSGGEVRGGEFQGMSFHLRCEGDRGDEMRVRLGPVVHMYVCGSDERIGTGAGGE